MHVDPDVPTLYRRALGDLGVAADAAAVAAALACAEGVYRAALRAGGDFEASLARARDFWEEYNDSVLAELGVPGGERRRALAARLGERFWSPASWRVFPEVHEVLGRLRAAGLQLAVVSNFTDAIVALCRSHELDGYLDCLVASATTGAQKPDAGIFREALRRLGAEPAACLHVGDNYVADVLGARAAGIDGVLLDRSRHGRAGMYDFALRDGIGGTAGMALDCPVIGDLGGLLTLLG